MKYGIFFKHPMNHKRGYAYNKNWINIEVIDNNFNMEKILVNLQQNWNSNNKLFKLQECGIVLKLESNINNSKTELSEFKSEYKTIKQYIDYDSGNINYLTKDHDGFSTAVLEVPLCCSETDEIAIKDCIDYDWEYAFFFNEKDKKWSSVKIENDGEKK